ncbi:MAG: hypothetical protein JWN38_1197 [Candidatus Saccharibacteria bacterium]|nr:hypothetical protein [Candidatus Saccharibacteria bacterium]
MPYVIQRIIHSYKQEPLLLQILHVGIALVYLIGFFALVLSNAYLLYAASIVMIIVLAVLYAFLRTSSVGHD